MYIVIYHIQIYRKLIIYISKLIMYIDIGFPKYFYLIELFDKPDTPLLTCGFFCRSVVLYNVLILCIILFIDENYGDLCLNMMGHLYFNIELVYCL